MHNSKIRYIAVLYVLLFIIIYNNYYEYNDNIIINDK